MPVLASVSARASSLLWATCLMGGLVATAGCGDTGSDDDGDTTTTAADGDTGGTGDTDGDTGAWEPIPARGDIELTHVIVNQGVDVQIATEGVWVGPADRNTYVVANRDTLLRGFWSYPEDWVPRDILARLYLEYPDGTNETLEDIWTIDAESYPGSFDRAFVFPLQAHQFPPGIKYHLSLWEAGPGYEDQRESTTVIESPIGGAEQVGVQPEPAELKIVMIPVEYEIPGCSTNTGSFDTITEAQETRYLNFLHEQYPITEIQWEFRRDDPIYFDFEMTSLTQLHGPLQQIRTDDAAAPNVYYYALVDACVGGIDDAGGVAAGIPPDTKDAAYNRVASGLWLGGDDYAYETMVHEIGHLHGRSHVFCTGGGAAGTDPTYPYENGITNGWGFGIRLFQFHSPTASYDFMTYCNPTWVSDWGWSKAYNRVRTLTSWDYEGASSEQQSDNEVLIGRLFTDGTEEWTKTPGALPPEYFSSEELVVFDYGDEVFESRASVEILDDGTKTVTVMVPRTHTDFETATRIASGGEASPVVLQTPQTRAWRVK